jgi:1,4-alpha-glucan branching enzyme
MYAWSENFILPFSHDEVVHMKGSLINKMQGNRSAKFADLRALYAYMWAHPGKKLLFMGGEIAQWREWNDNQSLDWHLLDEAEHAGVQALVSDINHLYHAQPALWESDASPAGFQWIDVNNAEESIVAFLRIETAKGRQLIAVCNFSLTEKKSYRLGLPRKGEYSLLLNTSAEKYGGHITSFPDSLIAEEMPKGDFKYSAAVDLPALSTLWYEAPEDSSNDILMSESPA